MLAYNIGEMGGRWNAHGIKTTTALEIERYAENKSIQSRRSRGHMNKIRNNETNLDIFMSITTFLQYIYLLFLLEFA